MKKACEMSRDEIAFYIDYAVLKPEMTEEEIVSAAKKGIDLKVRSICVNPLWIPVLEPFVKGTKTKISPVVDFPFGCSSTKSRIVQLEAVLPYESVEEVDIVIPIGLLKSGQDNEVICDLKTCADTCHRFAKELKVILETDALSKEEIIRGCACCKEAGVDFVKTSTGFLSGHELRGAANDVVELILKEVKGVCKVKGSGVIRTREHALELIDLGCDRLGVNYTSAVKILEECDA